ncbi:MAG: rhodanese-like domain-containing protein [Pseudomonadota bacterium]|nr:rhodanese-like domain-containing protein [Pseudomonadota bacterium]
MINKRPIFLILALSIALPIVLHSTSLGKALFVDAFAYALEKSFSSILHDSALLIRDKMTQPKFIVVDVRATVEQEVSMIPDAITQTEFEKTIDRYRGFHVVTYCTIGQRSSKYAEKLKSLGYTVSNLRGGILAWAQNHLPLTHNGLSTKKVHTYTKFFSLLPEDYEPVF